MRHVALAFAVLPFAVIATTAAAEPITFTFSTVDADFTYGGTAYASADLSVSLTYDTADMQVGGGPNGGNFYEDAVATYSSVAAGLDEVSGTILMDLELGLPVGFNLPEFVQFGPEMSNFTAWVFDMPPGSISGYDGVSPFNDTDLGASSNGNGAVFTDVVGGLDLVSDTGDGLSDFTQTEGVGNITMTANVGPPPVPGPITFTFSTVDADFTYGGTAYASADLSVSLAYDTADMQVGGGPNGGNFYEDAVATYSSVAAGLDEVSGTILMDLELGLPVGFNLPDFVQFGPEMSNFTAWVFDMPPGSIAGYDGVSPFNDTDLGASSNGNGAVFTDVVGGLDLVSDTGDGLSDFTQTEGVGNITMTATVGPPPVPSPITFTFSTVDADFTYGGTAYASADLSVSLTYDTADMQFGGGPNGGNFYEDAVATYSSVAAGLDEVSGTTLMDLELGLPVGFNLPDFVQFGPEMSNFTAWVFDMPPGSIAGYDGVSPFSDTDLGALLNGNGVVFTDVVGGLDLVSDTGDRLSDFTQTEGVGNITMTATVGIGCPADLSMDGDVGFDDLLLLLSAWGTPDADLTNDGTTGFDDLVALLAQWGPCTP